MRKVKKLRVGFWCMIYPTKYGLNKYEDGKHVKVYNPVLIKVLNIGYERHGKEIIVRKVKVDWFQRSKKELKHIMWTIRSYTEFQFPAGDWYSLSKKELKLLKMLYEKS